MSGPRTYEAGVRVGNWFEDKAGYEEDMRMFLKQHKEGQLSTTRLAAVAAPLLAPASSATTASSTATSTAATTVCVGDAVQLRSVANGGCLSLLPPLLPTDAEILAVTTRGEVPPQRRNTLQIMRPGTAAGTPLCYGDALALGIVLDSGAVMLLQSEAATLYTGRSRMSGKQMVRFVEHNSGSSKENQDQKQQQKQQEQRKRALGGAVPSTCVWEMVHHNPQVRLEMEGVPVQAGEQVLLRHTATNDLLCVLHTAQMIASQFGLECEVVCHTQLDSHRAEMPPNLWLLATV